MAKTRDLIASCWTIAGNSYPGDGREIATFGFADRVHAAVAAGYRGIGLVHGDLLALKASIGYREMRRILDDHDVRIVEIEFLSDWFATGERRAASDLVRADLFEAADALRARHIKVCGDMTGGDWPTKHLAEEFGQLCREAQTYGAMVGIEILPWSNLSAIPRTMEVVSGARASNGGLLLDIWHMVRGGISFADIADLPRTAIISVEIDDSGAEPHADTWDETLHHRKLCGEGAFDIPGFLAALDRTGYAGPIGVEILSAEQRTLPLDVAARRSFETASRFFERVA